MKKSAYGVLLVLMALLLCGCGSDITISSTITVPVSAGPEITAMTFANDGGRQVVEGTVEFLARDADLETMTIVVLDSWGREISRSSTDLRSFRGYAAGTLYFLVDYISYLPGSYTFTVYLTDRAGLYSNPSYGTFVVR